MNTVGIKIRESLLKRQEAMEKFQIRKAEFLLTKQMIISDIEEAREIWRSTLEKLPRQGFDQ